MSLGETAQPAGSRHFSFRIPTQLYGRLSEAAERLRVSTRSGLAVELIDEGLRMREHPGVVFAPGPAGRRPRVAGGPDVWVIARVLREQAAAEDGLVRTAELMEIPLHQVRSAARYYRDYKHEVDAWIDDLDRIADEEAGRAPGA